MTLRKVWEYSIQAERTNHEYTGWIIISSLAPTEGWAAIFETLSNRGDMHDIQQIKSASCWQKEILE